MKINKKAPFYEVREITDLKDMLNSSAELYADRVAFLRKEKAGEAYKEVTYKEFKEDVDALRNCTYRYGIKR